MNTVWKYTVELAAAIANLYGNNSSYNNVRVFFLIMLEDIRGTLTRGWWRIYMG